MARSTLSLWGICAAGSSQRPAAATARIRVWDLEIERHGSALRSKGTVARCGRWPSGGCASARSVVSGSNDNTVRGWDVDSGRPVYEPFVGHDSNVTGGIRWSGART